MKKGKINTVATVPKASRLKKGLGLKHTSHTEVKINRPSVNVVKFGKNRLIITPYKEFENDIKICESPQQVISFTRKTPRLVTFIGKIIRD